MMVKDTARDFTHILCNFRLMSIHRYQVKIQIFHYKGVNVEERY